VANVYYTQISQPASALFKQSALCLNDAAIASGRFDACSADVGGIETVAPTPDVSLGAPIVVKVDDVDTFTRVEPNHFLNKENDPGSLTSSG
jgi:hypothetical protein